ncbi:hypothetical protein B0H15DRAFT_535496 [Mycena belliarum]|uniref:Uncharacterized protein n=1 Tax=Mycena belliarum TaxID=1033014 RepID=A0AAD6XPG5_9AGAR|nr:hypothetical protein B0H15DRAFT_535496 [Mycena belliae]
MGSIVARPTSSVRINPVRRLTPPFIHISLDHHAQTPHKKVQRRRDRGHRPNAPDKGRSPCAAAICRPRLPTVSSKTSYKDIWKHAKQLHAARRAMSAVSTKVVQRSREAKKTYCSAVFELPEDELRVFLAWQSRSLDDLLDDCEDLSKRCAELKADAERDQAKLQAEVTRVKVATNSKERRELLLELTRAVPIVSCVQDVFDNVTQGLKEIQKEVENLGDDSDAFHRIGAAWEVILVGGVQLLA